jgi:hypothetical protein
MRYQRIGEIGRQGAGGDAPTGTLRAVALDAAGNWYLGGDGGVQRFDPRGVSQASWSTAQPVWSLGVDPEGRVWAGEAGQIEIFDPAGERLDLWQQSAHFALVTALGFSGSDSFVADAGSRWIHRFDSERLLVNHIGDRHRKGGFHIPNGVVDFAVDRDGTLVVANPGMHRVERYAANGESLGFFGQFGQNDPAGFPGCCNPTNVALGPAGEVIVSEKAGPRVKVYDPEGQLLSVVTATHDFAPECKNMDLVVTPAGEIGVVDPIDGVVVVFAPQAGDEPLEETS